MLVCFNASGVDATGRDRKRRALCERADLGRSEPTCLLTLLKPSRKTCINNSRRGTGGGMEAEVLRDERTSVEVVSGC